MLPVLRRMVPNLLAFELVGVQPSPAIPASVENVYALRTKYSESTEKYHPSPEGILEAVSGPRLSIQIMKHPIEYKTLPYETAYTLGKDIKKYGRGIEIETLEILAKELIAENDLELIRYLNDLVGEPTSIFDTSLNPNAHFLGDAYAALAILINRQANLIAARTRRGAGNWCVVSPTALTILQSATASAFARTTDSFENKNSFVGTLNGSIKVYCNRYLDNDSPVLVGYKGYSEIDAGVFYGPFSPLLRDYANTDDSVITLYKKYGLVSSPNSIETMGNGRDYYGSIGIKLKTFS